MGLARADFDRLVADHGAALYRVAYRMIGDAYDAEDVVQETYRSVWKGRHTFDSSRSQRAWLMAILRRRIADRWRKHGKLPTLAAGDHELEVGVEDEAPWRDEYTDEVQHALDQLSPELRETLLLVVVGELTHQATADLLQVPLGTVLSRVSRARSRLRKQLSPGGGASDAHRPPVR